MQTILLVTANARYSHTALGLRSLRANLGLWREQCQICEFVLTDRPEVIVEQCLERKPQLIGLSVAIWNVELIAQVVQLLKSLQPALPIVLGGPEMIASADWPDFARLADVVVVGEGELAFCQVVAEWMEKRRFSKRMWSSPILDPSCLKTVDQEYSEEDIAHRVIYLEASRGCSLGCEFCLSANDVPIRRLDEQKLRASIQRLWNRGARRYKFVDRSLGSGIRSVLDFFIERQADPDLFLHFELIPSALTKPLIQALAAFGPGRLQLEVGVQTFNPVVAKRIGRPLSAEKIEAGLKRLLTQTSVHLHTDLIAGLPGEDRDSVKASFDRLYSIGPHEIQLGILKRLRGAKISRHTQPYKMVYRDRAPYDVMQTSTLDFGTLQKIKRFARYFDLVANSGNFASTSRLVLRGASAFDSFWAFSHWLYQRTQATENLGLSRLSQCLFDYLTEEKALAAQTAANHLVNDFARVHRRKGLPDPIRKQASVDPVVLDPPSRLLGWADRQRRHR